MRVRFIVHGDKIDRGTFEQALAESGVAERSVTIEIHWTTGPGDAIELAATAGPAGIDRVVALGGDGTINEVVSGLMRCAEQRPALAIVPLGTANDLARSIELPASLDQALALALAGPTKPVDVGWVGDRPFLNIISGGVMSEATAALDPKVKEVLGGLAYTMAGLLQLPSITPVELELETPDWTWSGPVLALGVGNARTAGGGFELCPEAAMDDGRLDLTIVPAGIEVSELARILTARSVAVSEGVITRRCRSIQLRAGASIHLNIDGEPAELGEATFTLTPGALQLCQGPRP